MRRSPLVITGILLFAIQLALALALYNRLPDPVPTHFDAQGHANGFTPKPFGAFIGPLIIAALTFVMAALPAISPRGYRMEAFRRTYDVLATAILGVVFFLLSVALWSATHGPFKPDRLLLIGMGALLVVVGNFMGKLTRNFFIGIRTPWTLASEEVWFRTHRVGGWVFVATGVVLFAGAFAGAGPGLLIGVTGAAAIAVTVYSYVIYRRIEGNPRDDGPA